jgi:hypothetical protein
MKIFLQAAVTHERPLREYAMPSAIPDDFLDRSLSRKSKRRATGYSGPAVLILDGCTAHDGDYFGISASARTLSRLVDLQEFEISRQHAPELDAAAGSDDVGSLPVSGPELDAAGGRSVSTIRLRSRYVNNSINHSFQKRSFSPFSTHSKHMQTTVLILTALWIPFSSMATFFR